ncbi:MAG: molybdopterin-dependent oxidoreductase [Actinobacteria bacterium]|nr:molybdopterin-dependent oxidoreductase [Actinomycetota bacterium]
MRSHGRRRAVRGAGLLVLLTAAALGLVALAGACGDGSGDQAGSPSPAATGPVVLTVKGDDATRTFTMAELKALPSYVGYAGSKSSTGVITPPSRYKGVPLTDLADLVGGVSEANGITIVAEDGYGMTFSYRQITGDGFTTFDPATGEEEPADGELTVIVAYEHEGEPIPDEDGPLKLAIAQDTPAQVTEGHWAIKWLSEVSVTKASAAWKVQLEGAVPGKIDRASYVNCASPGCHGSGWVDDEGRRWEGIPLYLVAGMVDDRKKHDAGAYNARLAKQGYDIQIETVHGDVVTIDSREIAGKDSVVLSSKVDGGELPDEYFPLRLVGPGLSDRQMPGGIARIVVRAR